MNHERYNLMRDQFERQCTRDRFDADHLKFIASSIIDWAKAKTEGEIQDILVERAEWIIRTANNMEWWAKEHQTSFAFDDVNLIK